MIHLTTQHALACCCALLAATVGCEKSDNSSGSPTMGSGTRQDTPPPPDRPRRDAAKESHAEAKDETSARATSQPSTALRTATLPGEALEMDGLTMKVPDGWAIQEVSPGPFAPVAAYTLPKAGEDSANGSVRITHYPNMKGMDDMNIQRWLAQVTHADGTPYKREEARIDVKEVGSVRLTVVDLTGSVKATMRDTPHQNSRMIATILDHPKGPHFVVATGGVATMAKWEGSISAFLKSATVK